jgi:YHS domain-containing protein
MGISTKEDLVKKNFRLLAIGIAIALLGLFVAAAQTAGDTVKDPVCGMSLKVEGATHTAENLGKTYYFCSEDCKAAFLKDPAKFTAPTAAESPAPEAKKGCGMCGPCCGKMSGMKMKMMPGEAPAAPAPCAPPAPPVPPASPEAVAPCDAAPECPMMKHAERPCCPMMAHEGMRMKMKMMRKMPMKPGLMGHMTMGACPMSGGMAGKAEIAIENTPDGAVVRITSKDPAAVKMIQEHLAAMKAACAPATCPEAKKAEEKKEK